MSNLKTLSSISLRDVILEKARLIFEEEGYAKLSARKVAQRVGCAIGSIYVHFENMDALANALVEKSLNKLSDNLSAASELEPRQSLIAACRSYIEFGLDNPEDYRVAFIYQLKSGPIYPHQSFQHLASLIFRYQQSGRIAAVETELAAQIVWSHLHGLVSLMLQKPGFPWQAREQLIEKSIGTLINGLD